MLLSINLLLTLLLYFLLGFIVACLELCFQHYMTPGMIFNKYALWLLKFKEASEYIKEQYGSLSHMKFSHRLIAYLTNPLGLCPYCNSTWIAIVVYIYFFELQLSIFLFIGIVFFFVHYLKTKTFK